MEASKFIKVAIPECIIKTSAIFLNSLGIYLLSQVRNTRTNQNMILMNLSSAEILLCLLSTTKDIIRMVRISGKEDSPGQRIFRALSYGFIFTYYLLMISVTLDRLLMSVLSIKYRIIMTTLKIKIILAVSWITGQALGLRLCFLTQIEQQNVLNIFISPILSGVFILSASITYSYIFYKLNNRKRYLHKNTRGNSAKKANQVSQQRDDLKKFYSVTGLIILSFTILVAIPSTLKNFLIYPNYKDPYQTLEYLISTALHYANYAADPCIYIFLQPSIRRLLKNKVTFCGNNQDNT